jgi:hypothetical protein
VRIDETQRSWAIASAVIVAASAVVYAVYVTLSPRGPSGGSTVGLIFGITGFGMMIFAALLSMRKKYPIWRIGRAQTWMRGHLWLGLISYPLILFHAGFHWGGSLTRIMMWVFTIVIVSGVLGAAIQHFMPRIMTVSVPYETIYYQIDRVQAQLLKEADDLISSLSESALHYGILVPSGGGTSHGSTTTLVRVDLKAVLNVRQMYDKTVHHYLQQQGAYDHELNDPKIAKGVFTQMRTLTPNSLHAMLNDIENICEEKRNLDRQSRLHRFLHGWLLVHVPLSLLLIALGFIHAVMALRY